MDERTGIERIRTATFSLERRGYDKREVEQFLNRIADWLETGGGDESRADVVKRELERVGQRTASILATAEDSAEQIRADAAEVAATTVNEARAEAAKERQAADQYSSETRGAAEAKAKRIVEEGTVRRHEIETVIADLVERRDELVAEVERITDELRRVAERHAHRPGEDRFEEPTELDPDERVEA